MSLQEVSNELMKPVKELADWEYPLSQILEKYYCLLENPTEINYGEAALIVQNSVDVYTKRVDFLNKEVTGLNQCFIEHEAQEEKAKSKNRERKSRKTVIDFDNFEPLDFEKEVGKNINMKIQAQKPVKLLNRRFTQLETSAVQVRFPIEIVDIHGEAIGKKYDFRCNHQLTMSGMLVDECMPSDFNQPQIVIDQEVLSTTTGSRMSNSSTHCSDSLFNDSIQSRISPEREESTLNLTNSSNGNCSSQEDCSYFSESAISSCEQITSEIGESSKRNESSVINESSTIIESPTINESSSTINESPTINEPSMMNESSQSKESSENESSLNNESSENNESSLNKDSSKSDTLDSENTSEINGSSNSSEKQSCTIQENTDDTLRNVESSLGSDSVERIADEPDHFDEGHQDFDDGLEEHEEDERKEAARNCKETDLGYRSEESEDYEIPKRRSKRMKNMVCVVKDINKNIWKPIPFDEGIPEKLPKSRSKFKLPCHISLLKSKSISRKRKMLSESRKSESLPKFLSNESESPLKKMNMYSPSRPFMTLKTEDLLDFQKTFDDSFKSKQCCDVFHYEAATTITMDLLGFFPSFAKHDPLSNSLPIKTLAATPEHVSASFSDREFSPRSVSPGIAIYDCNTPPDSPAMGDTFDSDEPLHSTLNYQQLVECRMREIREEFDNRTDLEQGVAMWHRDIKPILQEAERRPSFHIHEYEARILEKLEESIERKIAFEKAVDEESTAEIARYFLASLQLANSYNVNIKTDEENTNIELLLISSENTRREVPYETPKTSKVKKTKRFSHIA